MEFNPFKCLHLTISNKHQRLNHSYYIFNHLKQKVSDAGIIFDEHITQKKTTFMTSVPRPMLLKLLSKEKSHGLQCWAAVLMVGVIQPPNQQTKYLYSLVSLSLVNCWSTESFNSSLKDVNGYVPLIRIYAWTLLLLCKPI